MNIHAQRFGSYLRQLFQPPGSDTFGLTPDIFPVAPLVHPDNSELYRNRGERWFSGTLSQAGVAAQVSNWVIGSAPGMITVVEEVAIITNGAAGQQVQFGSTIGPSGFTFAAQSFALDNRDVPRGKWAAGAETFGRRAVLTATNTAAAPPGGTNLGSWALAAAVSNVFRVRWVFMQPAADLGTFAQYAFFITTGSGLNLNLQVQVRGYERKYTDAELSDWT